MNLNNLDGEERHKIWMEISKFVDGHPRFGRRRLLSPDFVMSIRASVSDLILDTGFLDLFPFFIAALQEGYYPQWDSSENRFLWHPSDTAGPLRMLRYPRSRLEKESGNLILERSFLTERMREC